MNAFSFNQRLSARILAAVALFSLVASLVPMQAFATAQEKPIKCDKGFHLEGDTCVADPVVVADLNPNVDVCHATSAETNPFSFFHVDAKSIVNLPNGHDDHGDDIIPPFDYNFDGGDIEHYPGKNWDSEGQEIWDNDCDTPDPIDLCPDLPGNQQDPTDCTPPPTDLCSNIPEVQTSVPQGYYADGGACYQNPVDLCLNIPEVQTTVPTGLVVNDNGDCVEPPVDICPNLENLQTVMPTGYHLSDGLCVPDAVDLCLNIPEVQTTVPTGLVVNDNGDCVEPPVDICPNLENLQTEVPTGYVLVDGLCLIPVVDQCPNIPEVQNEIPSGMVKDDSGNCVTPIVDICPNIPEVQTVVPTGYHLNTENQCVPDGDSDPDPVCENPKAQNYGEKGTCVVYTSACVAYPANLLTNGSFEEPTPTANGGQWEIFSSITGWIATNGIEIWNNLIPASHGNQNAELDTTGPTKITQSVATVPGATYELRFDFAARSGADNAIEATASTSVIQSVTTSNTSWVTYGGTFVATGALTDVSFEDKGVTPNSLGTLVDNAVLCLVDLPDDNGGDDEEVLSCELTVDDAAIRRGGDVTLSWTSVGASFANLLNNSVATSGELFIEDIDEDTTYTLTVYDKRENPATCSVTVDTRSGGGGGTRVDRDRDGEVLGDSDSVEPTPLVLGEQVSAVPLGAADAGAGSTAPKTVEFFRLAPVAFIRRK